MNKIFLLSSFLLCFLSVFSQYSGTCGDPNVNGGKNVKWTLSNGTLTISGTGAMLDYKGGATSTSEIFGWRNYQNDITSVVIKSGVTNVGTSAFVSCSKISSVTLATSVKKIGDDAFNGCSSLKNIVLSNALTSIGSRSFQLTTSIKNITLPSTIQSIGSYAFLNSSLDTVICEATTPPTLGLYSFGYSKLDVLYVHDVATYDDANWKSNFKEIRKIGDTYYTVSLICDDSQGWVTGDGTYKKGTSVTISASPWTDSGYEFKRWSDGNTDNPRTLTVTKNLTLTAEFTQKITNNKYTVTLNCDLLQGSVSGGGTYDVGTSITISATPKTGYKFICWSDGNTDNPRTLTVTKNISLTAEFDEDVEPSDRLCGETAYWNLSDDGVLTITGWGEMYNYFSPQEIPWLNYLNRIQSVIIGENITSIGDFAFSYCSSLTSVTIPNSVTNIKRWAFLYCSSLISVTIPESVTSIGYWAFNECSKLNTIYCYATTPPSTDKCFDDYSATLYVPCSSQADYKASAEWVKFNDIQCIVVDSDEETDKYTVTLNCDLLQGSVSGGGTYDKGTSITISATPKEEYRFVRWSDGNTSNPRTLTVTENRTLTAEFDKNIELSDMLCGESVYWNVSDDDILMITGFGDMYNYEEGDRKPWDEYWWIKSIIIGDNVTSIGSYAFRFCSSATSITIGKSVKSIGEYAFKGCSELTSVTIPNSVTSIGGYAFADCSKVTSVTIPNSVTSIGGSAFWYCSSLTSINIPNSVTSIGHAAFSECSSLSSVTIGNSVKSIGKFTFSNCSSLTSVTIPNSVTSIGEYAFDDCPSLTSVTMQSNTPPTVEESAFKNISSNAVLYISDTANKQAYHNALGQYFSEIVGGRTPFPYEIEIKFHENRGTIEFVQQPDWDKPAIVKAIPKEGYVFGLWEDGEIGNPRTFYVTSDTTFWAYFAPTSGECGDNLTWKYSNHILTISGTGDMWDFSGTNVPWEDLCGQVHTISLPTGITSISNRAFFAFTEIASIDLPSSLISIGSSAFMYCEKLTSITIPNSVTSIGYEAFYGCSSITCVILTASSEEDFCKGKGNKLLSSRGVDCQRKIQINGTEVTDFTIPNSVTSIGDSAFMDCSSLTSITIGSGVTSIGNGAFYGCDELDTVYCYAVAPPSTDEESFDNYYATLYVPCDVQDYYQAHEVWGQFDEIQCVDLEPSDRLCGDNAYWNLKDGVLTITGWGNMYDWFANTEVPWYNYLNRIHSIIIGESVTSIGDRAFYGCSSLASVTIPESVTSIGDQAFSGCSSLASLTIPNSVTSIGYKAFYGCSSLISVTLNSDAIVSEEYSVRNNLRGLFGLQVEEYIIGNNVSSIGKSAFSGSSKLTSVTIGNSVTSIGNRAFYSCDELDTVYCYAVAPPSTDEESFDNYYATLYVPCGVQDYYQAHEVWGQFEDIQCVEEDSDDDNDESNDDNDDSNALPNSPSNQHPTLTKFLRDGQLIIIRDGVEYNALGQEM